MPELSSESTSSSDHAAYYYYTPDRYSPTHTHTHTHTHTQSQIHFPFRSCNLLLLHSKQILTYTHTFYLRMLRANTKSTVHCVIFR